MLATASPDTVRKRMEGRLLVKDCTLLDRETVHPHRAVVVGKSSLRGDEISSPDIRAGMALMQAALCASGESTIFNVRQIDRGYEAIERRLEMLGARIRRFVD